ncbi:hypothetical protein [Chondrinema litorale]|uniref:hypothetical protein n=1 Tax=Chondrinema litorale TaxID=2994555 RepID=UPI0025429EF1|nr:hypothetical protein [Chondrinema litorale]UZR95930.1 hypothetical protein OQ292_08905 [Chondrinema litorale]
MILNFTTILNNINPLELIKEYGLLGSIPVYLFILFVFITWNYKDKFAKKVLDIQHELWMFLHLKTLQMRESHLQKISDRVAAVYTQMYRLLQLAPVSIQVMQFRKAKRGEQYQCWIRYDTSMKFHYAKMNMQGIFISEQLVDILVHQTAEKKDDGLYIPDMQNLPEGHLKDYLQSQEIQSFFSIQIDEKKQSTYTLVVSFNRVDPELSGAEKSQIRLAARNIQKFLFKKELSFSEIQY